MKNILKKSIRFVKSNYLSIVLMIAAITAMIFTGGAHAGEISSTLALGPAASRFSSTSTPVQVNQQTGQMETVPVQNPGMTVTKNAAPVVNQGTLTNVENGSDAVPIAMQYSYTLDNIGGDGDALYLIGCANGYYAALNPGTVYNDPTSGTVPYSTMKLDLLGGKQIIKFINYQTSSDPDQFAQQFGFVHGSMNGGSGLNPEILSLAKRNDQFTQLLQTFSFVDTNRRPVISKDRGLLIKVLKGEKVTLSFELEYKAAV